MCKVKITNQIKRSIAKDIKEEIKGKDFAEIGVFYNPNTNNFFIDNTQHTDRYKLEGKVLYNIVEYYKSDGKITLSEIEKMIFGNSDTIEIEPSNNNKQEEIHVNKNYKIDWLNGDKWSTITVEEAKAIFNKPLRWKRIKHIEELPNNRIAVNYVDGGVICYQNIHGTYGFPVKIVNR